ncbi:MAG: hypothetical protein VW362_11120 [Candidatus Nanopelagicales bacterium]
MPPITMVFLLTGIAVFVQAMYFLGVGASQQEGQKNPIVAAGWIALTAGIADLAVAFYVTVGRPIEADPSLILSGLLAIYGLFFVALGVVEICGLDLRVVGNLAIATGIIPLFWIPFFSGSLTVQAHLVWWLIAFLSITLTTYGKMKPKVLGWILMITAVVFFLAFPLGLINNVSFP